MDGLRPCRFKRGTCRAVRHHRRSQEQASPGRIGRGTSKRPKARRHLTAGLRPGREERSAALAARCGSTARGKAWSKRPDRQAGRHGRKRPPLRGAKTGTNHARPTSRPPAQPGACARHAGKVRGDRKSEKPFSKKEGAALPSIVARRRRRRPATAFSAPSLYRGCGKGERCLNRVLWAFAFVLRFSVVPSAGD